MNTAVGRHEVIMAGLGGGGVLTAGRLLAAAAMENFAHTLWYPSYAMASRGGSCECTIVLSHEEIYSQLLDQATVLIALHPSQMKAFENRMRPGGLMMVEQMGLKDKLERSDLRLIEVPAVQTAMTTLGGTQGANLIFLGAYVGLAKTVPAESVERVIEQRFKGRTSAQEGNLAAFRAGLALSDRLS